MKMLLRSSRIALAVVGALVIGLASQPTMAQDKEPVEVKKEIKVLVDDDGNVTVNGEPVSGDRVELEDGSVVVRDEHGKVIVIEREDGPDRLVRRHHMMHPGDKFRVFKMRDGDEDGFEWYERSGDEERATWDRVHPFEGMLGRDFDFDFDFEHMNPEIMEMEVAARRLANEVKNLKGNEKTQKEKELSDKLSQIFDKKLENRKERIMKMQERVDKERTELNDRQKERTRIIERRKAELLGDDTLKW